MIKKILFVMHVDVIHPLIDFFQNSGDTVYFSAGASFFWKQDVTYIQTSDLQAKLAIDPDWVKNNFHIAIMMEACIFFEGYNDTLKEMGILIRKLKIPTFVLGAGIQSPKDYSENFLTKIKENACFYLDSIFLSGGDISLRGYFTKYCLEKFGYKNLFVSGCPSLYISGKDLHISEKRVLFNEFKPMLSGDRVTDISSRIYKKYKKSCYFDQDIYLKKIYYPKDNFTNKESLLVKLYSQNRIFGDMNYYMWVQQIINGGFNFSYGSRIHGNIIALQQAIPAYVKIIDARTREICEFYKIPNSIEYPFNEKHDDLYDLYTSLDYSNFNINYLEKYNNFINFLSSKNIPNNVGSSEEFLIYLSKLKYYDWIRSSEVLSFKEKLKRKLFFRLFNKFL